MTQVKKKVLQSLQSTKVANKTSLYENNIVGFQSFFQSCLYITLLIQPALKSNNIPNIQNTW